MALVSHEGGGISSVSKGLAKSLVRKGVEVTIFTGAQEQLHELSGEKVEIVSLPIPNFPPRNVWFQALNLKKLSTLLKDYSVIHGVSPYSTFGLTFFRNLFPQPIITTIHESHRITQKAFVNQPTSSWTSRDIGFNFFAFPLYDYSVFRAIQASDVVTCCSYSLLENLKVYKELDLGKIKVIYNGVDFDEINRIHPPSNEKDFNIFFAGRLYLSKGVTYLLDAFRRLSKRFPDMHLTICGKGPLENVVKRTISSEELKDRITYLGYVSHQRVLEEIKRSDIVVFPSLQESQSMFMLEAMACEKPLVCFDLPFSREILKHRITGILATAYDVNSLCENIELLYRDGSLKASIEKNALDYVKREHNWDIQANKYIELYEKMIL
ncbi:MAG: glycosyltransferase family 4 protein [Candidatus Bathyarchaeota archaeon]|nr:glycosyltransferase family 4 protein [Candidatus Bathyarchaeota archaeon]